MGVHEPPPHHREVLTRHCISNCGWLTQGLDDGRVTFLPPELAWPPGVPMPVLEHRRRDDGGVPWWYWAVPGEEAVPICPANRGDLAVPRLDELLTAHRAWQPTPP
ncbi:hypothetical protein [Actinomadura hibisca]|uniref:hypothetical protein n=1 Tax=Actinomadura hibisca TaxID=68565 RepID=UPI000AB69AD8|nr:hypothetical protein [Actinomadura hibisca]